MLHERVDLDDKIGYLFLVDIRFDMLKETPKQYMYNEIQCPIFEKKKILDAKKICFQLSKTWHKGDKSYVCTKKNSFDYA